jgi:hypothetical protein
MYYVVFAPTDRHYLMFAESVGHISSQHICSTNIGRPTNLQDLIDAFTSKAKQGTPNNAVRYTQDLWNAAATRFGICPPIGI